MPKYSIITPMYNSFDLMERYFVSLNNQTVKDFEVIIIDDCSTDESYHRACEFAENSDLNITVLRTDTNAGPGNARNIGLKEATGEYVLFVDSDDYVSEALIGTLSKVSNNCDVVFFDYYRTNGKRAIYNKTLFVKSKDITKENALLYSTTSVCGKAIKRDLLCRFNIEFPMLYRYEDWVFMASAMCHSTSYTYIQDGLYFYYNNPKSIVHTSPQNAYEYSIQAFNILESDLKGVSLKVAEAVFAREVLYVVAKSAPSMDKVSFRDMMDQLQKRYPNWYTNKALSEFRFYQRVILCMIHQRKYILLRSICKII